VFTSSEYNHYAPVYYDQQHDINKLLTQSYGHHHLIEDMATSTKYTNFRDAAGTGRVDIDSNDSVRVFTERELSKLNRARQFVPDPIRFDDNAAAVITGKKSIESNHDSTLALPLSYFKCFQHRRSYFPIFLFYGLRLRL
jgi:hypothetical protein